MKHYLFKLIFILMLVCTLPNVCIAQEKIELDGDSNGAMDVSKGGTNATTAANARTNLGVISDTGDTATGQYTITTDGAGNIPLAIKGAADQTAHLQTWKDSDDNIVARVQANGRIFTTSGFYADALDGGGALILFDKDGVNIEHNITNDAGNFDLTGGVYEELFTDTTNSPFTEDDADNPSWIIIRSGEHKGAMAKVQSYLDADNITLNTMGWDFDLSGVDYYIISNPMMVVGNNSHIEVGMNTDGYFDLHTKNWTGDTEGNLHVFNTDLDAAADNLHGIHVDAKANGNNNINTIISTYESGALPAGEVGRGIISEIDDNEATSADSTTLIAAFTARTTGTSNATKQGVVVRAGFSEALRVYGATSADPDYGYENTSTTVVDRVNSDGAGNDAFINAGVDVTIFDNNGDYILIGSDETFEIAVINLDTRSSKNIIPSFYYSKAGGNWTALSVLEDRTVGMTQSGNITFSAPGDWTKDDEDMDTNAITNAYYIAIERGYFPNIPVKPVENYIKLYDSKSIGMYIRGDGVIALPYLGFAPSNLENGMIWTESDGLHFYVGGTDQVVAGD